MIVTLYSIQIKQTDMLKMKLGRGTSDLYSLRPILPRLAFFTQGIVVYDVYDECARNNYVRR